MVAAALCSGLLIASTSRAGAAPSMDALCRNVVVAAGSYASVTTGVVVVDLETGDRCAINADRTYRTASLYKTIVAAELYRQIEAGTVTLDQSLTVEPRHGVD